MHVHFPPTWPSSVHTPQSYKPSLKGVLEWTPTQTPACGHLSRELQLPGDLNYGTEKGVPGLTWAYPLSPKDSLPFGEGYG